MYVPGPIADLIAALESTSWSAEERNASTSLLSICDHLRYSVVWDGDIINMLGPNYVARVHIPHCIPDTVFLKFCPPPNDVLFSARYQVIQEPLWQHGIFHIYGITQNWVVMEDVPQPPHEERELLPINELIADLWMRIHNIGTRPFENNPYIIRPDVALSLSMVFPSGYKQSRDCSEPVRKLFDDLKAHYDSVFSAILSPDPRDIVFCQGELYPRHTSFARRGAGWECRVIDWDSPTVGPRWHDLTFYLRVDHHLEDETLLPLYVRELSNQIPRDFDDVMRVYFQYSFLRILLHLSGHEMHIYFRDEVVTRYRKWLLE